MKRTDNNVVTGSAKQPITANLALWNVGSSTCGCT